MKECKKCGTQHDDAAKFCQSCGEAFEVVQETSIETNAQSTQSSIENKKDKNDKSSKKLADALTNAIVAALLLFIFNFCKIKVSFNGLIILYPLFFGSIVASLILTILSASTVIKALSNKIANGITIATLILCIFSSVVLLMNMTVMSCHVSNFRSYLEMRNEDNAYIYTNYHYEFEGLKDKLNITY